MRATTRGTLKTCLAICEAMMLRLSPSVTATKPSASSIPARRSTSASVPLPTTWSPLKSLVSTPREAARENWFGSRSMITTWWPDLSISAAICDPTRPVGAHLPHRPPGTRRCVPGHRRRHNRPLLGLCGLRPDPARQARPGALMPDHSHPPTSKKVLVAVGGQCIDTETVRLACRMTDNPGGKLYGVHIIEVNRSLPLGAVLDEVVERGEKILDEVEQLAAQSQLPVETELVQARDTGPALVDEAVEWGAELLVMGLPYKRRFGEFNLGKTVPYVLKNANCRVLLFREHREHPA